MSWTLINALSPNGGSLGIKRRILCEFTCGCLCNFGKIGITGSFANISKSARLDATRTRSPSLATIWQNGIVNPPGNNMNLALLVCFGLGRARLVHIITYDLKSPNDTAEDYERVIEGLKLAYPTWCHVEKSVWLVATEQDPSEIRDSIKTLLRPSDILFVARLSRNWALWEMGQRASVST
jgi:hypothetical protein